MKQFVIIIIFSCTFSFFSQAQSKIYFEDSEPELILDIANGVLLTTDIIPMKNENEDTIEVAWNFTLDIPTQENPDNENRLEAVWLVLLCDEVLCHSYPEAQSVIPPKDTYDWKFNVTSAFWLGYEWVLGEGSVTLTVTNIADQTETTSFTANLKIIDSSSEISGCTDADACNYETTANNDDGSCTFVNDACLDENGNEGMLNESCACVEAAVVIGGCTDATACNYNESATEDDDSCTFPANENVDCEGNCLTDEDCAGECGGSALAGSACTDVNGNESVYDDACTCVEFVDIAEFNLLSKALFPNPTSGIINLQLKDSNHSISSISVNNLQGQQVVSLFGLEAKASYQIDLSHVEKGLYQINLFNKDGILLYSDKIERQ